MTRSRILIADDHALLRMGLASLIGYQKDLEVVGEAKNGLEAVRLAADLKPDLVIMDLMMPDMNGAEATRRIHENDPKTRILILTSFGDSIDVVQALDNGASGVVLKDTPNDTLLDVMRNVAGGHTFVQPEIRQILDESPEKTILTPRQQEILHSAARGLSTEDIAKQFDISVDGVKKHFMAIFAKLNAATRSEAVAIALRKHLLKI